tara:strand:+ start:1593 stop:2057 length:465 start_codon:yes stop_codon:yes gene_type:complete
MYTQEFIDICRLKLEKGIQKFDLELGIVSHIENNAYHLVAVQDPSNTFSANDTFPLGDTYCREVINRAASVAIPKENEDRDIKNHPLYTGMPLEAYISSPILYQGRIWGTINFSSRQGQTAFTQDDIYFNERLAADIASSLYAAEKITGKKNYE